jgi:NAD(P)-dependent dehydrogenase (short-subunit alcohol dehydrogenase family)
MHALANKIAIITGASSGIGYAAAKLFAAEGAKVVVAARRAPELEQLVSEIRAKGGSAVALPGDVRDEAYAQALVELAIERFGGLDVAFNNAGGLGPLMPTSEVGLVDWEDALRVNLTSAFLAAKYQVPAMLKRKSGSIVFTSTFVGYTVGMPSMAAYAASKSGLVGLTQALAAELGSQGIRVNALLPGGTDTPMGRVVANTPEVLAYVRSLHALKRLAEPEEIAQAALYLASDASSFTTGSALLVDGGVSISRS